jgi:PAS domain S-box-containing protein
MSENLVQTSTRHVDETRAINRELTEKALHMRCLGYLANAKAQLLTQTIFEIDASKKALMHTNRETARQREIIAEQKRELEQKNRELESFSYSVQQRLLLHRQQTPLGIVEWNTDFKITDWNPSAERIFGYSREQAIGRPLAELIVAEADRQEAIDYWRELMDNKQPSQQINENITRLNKVRTCEWYNTPLVDEDGQVIGVASLVEDVTQRRQTEEALRRSQKMEAIGQLTGGIAHDFNNQLGVILGYLEFLQEYAADKSSTNKKPAQWVETATRATLRCTDLTRQLLTFSRRQGTDKTQVDLNGLLRDQRTMIARSVTPEVEVEYFLADGLWSTEIDPGEFQDAILNLVINARDAMPNGGKLIIETGNKHLDVDYSSVNPGLESGDYVQLILSDTGTGMDKETLEHVFEPFFTTKPEGKGTGLGMAMVYGFAQRYGGFIKIYSEPDMGTTLRLYLPRSMNAAAASMDQQQPPASLPGGDETILIVDDEVDLLQLANLYLSDLGYHTRLAENAAQALEILKEGNIDILFSDVVMPGGMNGYELARQATQQKPELKVLLTSGFTAKTVASNGLAHFSTHLLSKPYRKLDLAQRIRLVLDKAATI